ncbi:MAG: hypothetical protein A2675_02270 [Candidatus Yonathbacteria bacterium RIFCSPHIGHO2_01_FULL_51_10]|uniref:TspO protein n=1 Tax=Candidatus Yonathbacteria bacterium RIFCSPHIGHO2_01_FULL_51_10 TaxID=1802723 RepID=A0A1G2S6Z3_9BACT|nr:MAG: hypothetical protein A2675_02270 [Candidatus Yonathbacteria bacterium RIFCSPHIGHO2_01_FULL_51_10]
MKSNYIIIPLITIIVATVGSLLTSGGMDWYQTIALPSWTPSGAIIGAVWTVLFVLATISALIVWNKVERTWIFKHIIRFFIMNAVVNVLWSAAFFGVHLLGLAVITAAILALTVIMLVLLIWKSSRTAALLLVPYAVWVVFATYLSYAIWDLNLRLAAPWPCLSTGTCF